MVMKRPMVAFLTQLLLASQKGCIGWSEGGALREGDEKVIDKPDRQCSTPNCSRSLFAICICRKTKLRLPNSRFLSRTFGPPPSSRQYQSEKTRTFVSRSCVWRITDFRHQSA